MNKLTVLNIKCGFLASEAPNFVARAVNCGSGGFAVVANSFTTRARASKRDDGKSELDSVQSQSPKKHETPTFNPNGACVHASPASVNWHTRSLSLNPGREPSPPAWQPPASDHCGILWLRIILSRLLVGV